MLAMACCTPSPGPVDARRRQRAVWVLLVLGIVVLRGALPCHDGGGSASAIDRLIAASLCLTGDPGRAPGGAPLAPAGDPPGAAQACLHCTSGQGGALVLISLGLLAFAGWRPLAPAAGTARLRWPLRWPAAAARGPPWAPRQALAGATAS